MVKYKLGTGQDAPGDILKRGDTVVPILGPDRQQLLQLRIQSQQCPSFTYEQVGQIEARVVMKYLKENP